jgi:hypothetical protein
VQHALEVQRQHDRRDTQQTHEQQRGHHQRDGEVAVGERAQAEQRPVRAPQPELPPAEDGERTDAHEAPRPVLAMRTRQRSASLRRALYSTSLRSAAACSGSAPRAMECSWNALTRRVISSLLVPPRV